MKRLARPASCPPRPALDSLSHQVVPTIEETKEAIIIRIPKGSVTDSGRRPLTDAEILRFVRAGERQFQKGKTQEFGAFLGKRHPAYAKIFRRAR